MAIFTNRTASVHAWIGVGVAIVVLYLVKFHTDAHPLTIGAVGTVSCFVAGWLASRVPLTGGGVLAGTFAERCSNAGKGRGPWQKLQQGREVRFPFAYVPQGFHISW